MEEPTTREGTTIDDQMARQLERRRQQHPDRRRATAASSGLERRRICSYCFQRGDHRTVAQCLRALERSDRILREDE
jgi:hypothetical protein